MPPPPPPPVVPPLTEGTVHARPLMHHYLDLNLMTITQIDFHDGLNCIQYGRIKFSFKPFQNEHILKQKKVSYLMQLCLFVFSPSVLTSVADIQ